MKLSHKYEVERMELKSRIAKLQDRPNLIVTMQHNKGIVYWGDKMVYRNENADSDASDGTDRENHSLRNRGSGQKEKLVDCNPLQVYWDN